VVLVAALAAALAVQTGAGAAPALPARAAFDAATFDPLVRDGIARGAFPGAALVIGGRDGVRFAKGYGHLTWRTGGAAVSAESTLYDLASLTKVLATTTALMLLVERGKVELDAPVARYIPQFAGPGTEPITVRRLLDHTSGLRGTLPLHRDARDSAGALALVLAATPISRPGSRVLYSDLNAILLGELVARVTHESLDAFVSREVLGPLGLRQALFRPPARLRSRIAPTGVWRGTPVAGVVNDPNAARLGGVAGHAGLFATATDVARFARFMLAEGTTPDGVRVLRAETVRRFTAVAVPARRGQSARALGWQALPTDEDVSSAGTRFGPRSYGHTGWTGTSLWIDPERDLFVVLLTNRAYAPRSRRSFTVLKEVRGRVADAAARAADER
jgi:CubicO group peptidase (beta-lactamase class C family)